MRVLNRLKFKAAEQEDTIGHGNSEDLYSGTEEINLSARKTTTITRASRMFTRGEMSQNHVKTHRCAIIQNVFAESNKVERLRSMCPTAFRG